MTNPTISTKKLQPAAHGGGVRGDNSVPRSTFFAGRFGRMFRSLPAASPETDKRIQDDEENAGIPAGYTYLGQFIGQGRSRGCRHQQVIGDLPQGFRGQRAPVVLRIGGSARQAPNWKPDTIRSMGDLVHFAVS
jgi:hypothetical protein